MEINNFILSNHHKSEKFEYGIKLIPNKALNKFTDSIITSVERDVTGRDKYNLCFRKKIKFDVIFNGYNIKESQLKRYIDFLSKFSNSFNEEDSNKPMEFIIKNQGRIIVSFLNKNYVKISSIIEKGNSLNKIFFTLLKKELLAYISVLRKIYCDKEVGNTVNYQINYLTNPLSKKERENLYLNALYIFMDSVLEHRNKRLFYVLSKEINKISEL